MKHIRSAINQLNKGYRKVEWNIDYYLIYFTYNPNKIERYNQFMAKKWNTGNGEFSDKN